MVSKRDIPEAIVVLSRDEALMRYCHVFTEEQCVDDKVIYLKNNWPFYLNYVPSNIEKIISHLERIYLNKKDSVSEYGSILHVGSAVLFLNMAKGRDKFSNCLTHSERGGYGFFEYRDDKLEEWDLKKVINPFSFVLDDFNSNY